MNLCTPACLANLASLTDAAWLISKVRPGFRSPRGSFESPARWRMASKPFTSCRVASRTSLRISGICAIPSLKVLRSKRSVSSPTTSCPACNSIGTKTVPMYPACPVTNTRIRFLPSLPRCVTAFPIRFQDLLLANGIHTLPEAGVPVCHELAFAGQALEGLLFEVSIVTVDEVKDLGLKHKERSVDPAFLGLRLLRELGDLIAVHFQVTEARRRTDGGEGIQLAVRAMERQQVIQVDVGYTITPGEHEGFIAQVRSEPLDAAAGLGLHAGVDQVDVPVGNDAAVHFDLAGLERDAQIAVQGAIVEHVLLDDFAFVAQCDGELVEPVVGVMHHDVPENWLAANFDHRFRLKLRLFRETRP